MLNRFLFLLILLHYSNTSYSRDFTPWINKIEQSTSVAELKQEIVSIKSDTKRNEIEKSNEILILKSLIYELKGNLVDRIKYLSKVAHSTPAPSDEILSYVNYHLASVLSYNQLYSFASEHCEEGAKHARKLKNKNYLYLIDKVQAGIYFNNGNYDKALKLFEKCKEYKDSNISNSAKASNLNNIGLCQHHLGFYYIAISSFKNGLYLMKGQKTNNEKEVYYLIKGNLGSTYLKLKDYTAAYDALNQERTFYLSKNSSNENLISTDLELISLEFKMGNKKAYVELANETSKYIKAINNLDFKISQLSKLILKVDNYKIPVNRNELIQYQNELIDQKLKKSINTLKFIEELLYNEKINTLQRASQFERLNFLAERKSEQLKNGILISFFIISILVLLSIVFIVRQKAKQNQQALQIELQNQKLLDSEKIILEQENAIQLQHLQSLSTNLKIKQETENGFLNKLKDLKRKKGISVDQLIIELQQSVHNLIDIDKKIIKDRLPENNFNDEIRAKLRILFNQLSESDIEYCTYFISGLSAKEIGLLLNKSDVSVRVNKNKIKTKLNVPKEDDLIHFLKNELNK